MASLNELKIKITVLSEQLKAELNRVKSELDKLKNASNDKNQGQGFKQASQEAKGFKDNIVNAKTALLSFLSVGFGVFLGKQLLDVSEKWIQLTNTVKQATSSTDEYNAAINAVDAISRKTFTSLDANANLFAKINRALKDMGGSSEQSIFLTEMVAKLAGMETNAAGAAAGVYQLTQAIASGKFAGDEFRSVSEQLPIFAQTLAKGLGVSLGQLREMSRDGQLGTAEIMRGLSAQAGEVDKIFKSMPITASKAFQNLENSWTKFVGKLNEANRVSEKLGSAINLIADNLETIGSIALKVFGAVIIGSVVKLTASIYEYVRAQQVAALETRANAVAEAQAARAEAERIAALRAKVATQQANTLAEIASTRATIANLEAEIASLRTSIALTQSLAAREVLTGMLARATEGLAVANAQLAESQFALNAIQNQGNVSSGMLAKGMTALNAAMALWAGWEIGSWAREQFVWVEKFGIYLAGFADIALKALNPANWLNGSIKDSLDQWVDQFKAAGDESISAIEERKEAEAKAAEERKKQQDTEIKQFEDGIRKNQEKFERFNEVRKSEYDRDVREIERAEQAKLRAIDNTTPLKLNAEKSYQSQKQAIVDAGMLSELQKLQQRDATELQANQARVSSFQQYYSERLNQTNAIYQAEIETARKRGLDTTNLERESANAKRAILLEYERSYEQSIDALNAKEQDHRNKAIGYLQEIENREQGRAERLKQINEIGLSQIQIAEQRKQELTRGTQQVKDLIAAGELTKAKELSDKLEKIALDRVEATKQAELEAQQKNAQLPQQKANFLGDGEQFAQFESKIGSSSEALRQFNEIAKLGDSALKQLADTQTQQANNAKAQADEQSKQLTNVRNMIAEIDAAVKSANTLKINVDDGDARQKIEDLKKPTESTHTVRIVEARANGGLVQNQYATGGQVKGAGTGTSDSIPAMLSNGEYVIKADSVNKVGVSTLDHINLLGKLPKFAGGGLVNFTPNFQPTLAAQSQQSQQSQGQKQGETFTVNLSIGGKSGTVTGNKSGNEDLVSALAELATMQKRGMM